TSTDRGGFRMSFALAALTFVAAIAQTPPTAPPPPPPASEADLARLTEKLKKEKPEFAAKHKAMLEARYDLGDNPAAGVTMARGKPVQGGTRVKLPQGQTWESLAALAPDDIRA